MMPFSATPNLNLPPFLVKNITEHHANVIIKWADRIKKDRLYFSHQYGFWTRKRLSQEEAETGLIAEVIDKIFEQPADEDKDAIGEPAELEVLCDKVNLL